MKALLENVRACVTQPQEQRVIALLRRACGATIMQATEAKHLELVASVHAALLRAPDNDLGAHMECVLRVEPLMPQQVRAELEKELAQTAASARAEAVATMELQQVLEMAERHASVLRREMSVPSRKRVK